MKIIISSFSSLYLWSDPAPLIIHPQAPVFLDLIKIMKQSTQYQINHLYLEITNIIQHLNIGMVLLLLQ